MATIMFDKQAEYFKVMEGLDRFIYHHLSRMSYEQSNPSSNPDYSDESIKDDTNKAKELRLLRNEFERIVTGALL